MWHVGATAGQLEMQSNKLTGVELFRAIGKTVAFLPYFNFSFQLPLKPLEAAELRKKAHKRVKVYYNKMWKSDTEKMHHNDSQLRFMQCCCNFLTDISREKKRKMSFYE